MFEKLSQQSIKIIMLAQEEARIFESDFVETEHMLLGILREGNSIAAKFLITKNLNTEYVSNYVLNKKENNTVMTKSIEKQLSPYAKQTIELAEDEAKKDETKLIEPEHLLLGIVNRGEGIAIEILKEANISLRRLRWNLMRLKDGQEINDAQQNVLDKLTKDITSLIEQDKIYPVIGKDKYIEEIIHNLNLYNRICPLILGDKGVGKTSIAIGFTQYLLDSKIYKEFQNHRVLEFDFYNLIVEALHTEEIRLLFVNLINEIKKANDIILVIDNIDNIFEPKILESGIFHIFERVLRNKEIFCIATCETSAYEAKIEQYPFAKYFHLIQVEESDEFETKMFLEHWKNEIGKFHKLDIDESCIDTVLNLSKSLYPEKPNPASALSLIDLACSRKNYSRSIAQSRIKDMERHLRLLRNKRDHYIEIQNREMLEEIKKEANLYEEEIKILTINMSSSMRSILTSADIKLLLEKKIMEKKI